MKIYLTKTRWNILRIMSLNGTAHPTPTTVDTVKNRLGLSQHNATVSLNSMVVHRILVRVGGEYRVTRLGARLCDEMKTKTIDEITFEIPECK